MNRKHVAFVSAAAGLAAVAAVALSARAKTSAAAVAKVTAFPAVTAAEVKTVRSAPREEITGALNPAKELKMGFEVGGRLARIVVKKGAKVSEGQLIAQLDPEMVDAQVLQAEAAARAAEAQAA
ncbi:MAG TPA: biotin/lipoyl-binding protein, partial [Myxococcales bacterium]|nr:biotin/lipoyl-binding protein [Myxococcales bacterium]